MTTPAQDAGFAIGLKYRTVRDDARFSRTAAGAILTFVADDGTDTPRFSKENGEGCYAQIDDLEPMPVQGISFNTKSRTIETTVITVDRKLTTAEQASIAAIIQKGN